ncbi:hypothetical protein DEU56DRAFT_911095 [Suillus clintonianus]|uniref:uncharacterized protein n=1 Tax=Suillus clintonianus TaxID=1904413 RepID=UPI001B864CBB|nr:uncharacterized protein DEU56DRAFT_911095 [Suillus clintonianus]KAG2142393.1 hypothetical protein DEU56DRAFT_911095 [Suillus clintonianus]
MSDIVWRPEDDPNIRPPIQEGQVYRPDILNVIETTLDGLSRELRALSLDIHGHPELKFEEKYAHDACTAFMEKHGFAVTKHYHLETAWVATYTHGQGGRVLGVIAEMDALPGIGHGCGHNLVGISGVAVALAAKAAMERLNINGKVVLLGTPAGDGGDSKHMLYEKGACDEMDVCLMSHPASGPRHSINLSSTLTLSRIMVEYEGHTAHAALSPWEGQNALDAAVLAYINVSLFRQQLKPTHRVHGTFGGKNWAPSIIPDHATMEWQVRAPTLSETEDTRKRLISCIEAAALASGCKVQITVGRTRNEIRQNKALGDEIADVVLKRYGAMDSEWGMNNASSNFGYISYMMPSLRPNFAIPTIPNGGNHTPGFTEAARSEVSHDACLVASKALAAVGMRVLTDNVFFQKVKDTFEEDKRHRV